ncbi:MAG: 16S rRNA (cytosine(1402)-N(4))-methyltransferase RsmH [Acidimicrobiales bacterium]
MASSDQGFEHRPVMAAEVTDLFAAVPAGVVVDCTVGGGGHAGLLLEARPDLRLLGLDRDPDALAAAADRLAAYGDRVRLLRTRFGDLERVVAEELPGERGLAGVLLDLGVSSPQLDRPERGFSYRLSGPLDMRMDPSDRLSAADLVNTADVDDLAALFAANGEPRLSRRLARAVVAARPVGSTGELAEIVAAAVPAPGRRRGHPARRVFQALRIAVNDELGQLAAVLGPACRLLAVGGRCVVIAYHSGEDRLVKSAFADVASGGCTCPPGLPCVCGARPEHRLVFRGSRKAGPAEVAQNRRAESARLRAVERVAAPGQDR